LSPSAQPMFAAAATDTGRVRQHNEDAYLMNAELGLYAVADGVGGHGGGADASQLTVKHLPKLLRDEIAVHEQRGLSAAETQALLDQCIVAVNTLVYEAGEPNTAQGRMGTTLTGGLFLETGNAMIFNVGDSRTYRYRAGKLDRITTDQSWYQNWVDSGSRGPAPPRNVILQGIGLEERVSTDWIVTDCQPYDLWLSCSDGLSDLVADKAILALLRKKLGNSHKPRLSDDVLTSLCMALVDAANTAGGEDNITVLALSPKDKTP